MTFSSFWSQASGSDSWPASTFIATGIATPVVIVIVIPTAISSKAYEQVIIRIILHC